MEIKGLLYLYILFVTFISFVSYKKGIFLIWLSFLFIPTIILETPIVWYFSVETIIMLVSVLLELIHEERRQIWGHFFSNNQKAIVLLLFLYVVITLFSETVPLPYQIACFFSEIVMLLFALQTFLTLQNEQKIANTFIFFISCAVIFNALYCVFFEIYLGVNPAGMPLYILLGVDDNQFIVDMIDSERGDMSFRAQTIYRHPLSLGQYLLAFLPLFLTKGKTFIKLVFVSLICCLIVLSGTRGAMVPMALVLIFGFMKNVTFSFKKVLLFLFAVVLVVSLIPDKEWKKITEKVDPFVTSLQFWDDEKQKENEIHGSTMEMRIDQFSAAIEEIEGNPLFGRGYGYREYWQTKHNGLHPDLLGYESILIYYLVERGWIGLLFFFVMVFYIYKMFRRTSSNSYLIKLVILSFLLSITMTGIRPLSFLMVCLSCSIICGVSDKHELMLEQYNRNKV